MAERQSITVDVVSDVVCPWCFIGQKRLDRAVESLADIDVAFAGGPSSWIPPFRRKARTAGRYMLDKFGSEERIRQIHATIEPLGAAEGIAFDFGAIKVAPNTLDAHRVIRWAGAAGDDVQNWLVRRLFQLNFEEGANIGEHSVLVEAASEIGMDGPLVDSLLLDRCGPAKCNNRGGQRCPRGHPRRAMLPA